MLRLTKHGETKHVSRGTGGGEQIPTYHEGSAYNAVVAARSVWYFGRRNVWYWGCAINLAAFLYLFGIQGTALALAVVTVGMVGYWLAWPEHFQRHVINDIRGRLRLTFVYFRPWQSTCEQTNLAKKYGNVWSVPAILKVEGGRYVDRLVIKPPNGVPISKFREQTEALETTFCKRRVKVRHGDNGRIWLDVERRYALAKPVPALPIPETVADYTALPVGLTEFGTPWTQRVLGSHLFIAGMTGFGKSSFTWSIVRAMCPGIRDGSVRLWGIDPKGGMELDKGRALFAEGCLEFDRDPEKQVDLIERFVAAMIERSEQMRQLGMRKLETPTPEMPLNVLIVDEAAWIVAYDNDGKRKRNAESLFRKALSQGRALGFVVIFAVQDPRMEVCGFRPMFVDCVALRLRDANQVKMVLGDGVRELGAECDKIAHQGVAYVLLEDAIEPLEVRAGWVTDADLAYMCENYPAPVKHFAPPKTPIAVDADGMASVTELRPAS